MQPERLLLSEDEVIDLTGYRQHSRQAKALAEMGFRSWPRPDGSLAVLRTQFSPHIGTAATATSSQPRPKLRPA